MPVPKRKRSRARRDKRFANKGMKVKSMTECANCQAPLATHQACGVCGFYKGAKVMATKADRAVSRGEKRQARDQKKAAAASQQSMQEPQDVTPETESGK